MTTIMLEALGFALAGQTIVHPLDLTVPSGELLALLGPSGAGKSTLLKLVAGLEQPTHGDIRFDGASVLAVPPHRRGAVLMFQDAYLFPFLTVAENIAFGLRARKLTKPTINTAVSHMLELVELAGLERRYPRQLSGGQQQRVALARALVIEPQVLLLDEPLANLDPTIRATLQQVIRRLQRELTITTILVTHDLEEALMLADDIALVLDGHLAAHSAPEALFSAPPNRAAAEFVGFNLFLSGQREGDILHSQCGPIRIPANCHGTTFTIRPEQIRFSGDGITGIVREVLYRGSAIDYTVAVGLERVQVRSFDVNQRYQLDSCVKLEFPVEHLIAV